MAYNLREFGHLLWVMETSMTKTLAAKLKTRFSRVYRRFGTVIPPTGAPKGPPYHGRTWRWRCHTCRVRSRASCEAARRNPQDQPRRVRSHRSELLERLLADVCEPCGLRNRSRMTTRDRHGGSPGSASADLLRKGPSEKPLGQADGNRPSHEPWWSATNVTGTSTRDGPKRGTMP
jgi:hypothetical protein